MDVSGRAVCDGKRADAVVSGKRILRRLEWVPPSLTKRYEPVFIGLAFVKVSLRLASYQHVPPPSWPNLVVGLPHRTHDLHLPKLKVARSGLVARSKFSR